MTDCGCWIGNKIHHCALHVAAPAMLEALEALAADGGLLTVAFNLGRIANTDDVPEVARQVANEQSTHALSMRDTIRAAINLARGIGQNVEAGR
jgi:hypothetical protein